jgi:biopolymer transport protein ExbB/TolQ
MVGTFSLGGFLMASALMTALSYIPVVCVLVVLILACLYAYRCAGDARKVPSAVKHAESLSNLRAKLAARADDCAADEAFNESISAVREAVRRKEAAARFASTVERMKREAALEAAVRAARHSYTFTPNGTRMGVGPQRLKR